MQSSERIQSNELEESLFLLKVSTVDSTFPRFEKYAIRKAKGRGKSRDGDGKWAETAGEMDRKCALLPANAKAEECHSRRRPWISVRGTLY